MGPGDPPEPRIPKNPDRDKIRRVALVHPDLVRPSQSWQYSGNLKEDANTEATSVDCNYLTDTMEYKARRPSQPKVSPKIILHGGAGNVTPSALPPEKRKAYREALFSIVSFKLTPLPHS